MKTNWFHHFPEIKLLQASNSPLTGNRVCLTSLPLVDQNVALAFSLAIPVPIVTADMLHFWSGSVIQKLLT